MNVIKNLNADHEWKQLSGQYLENVYTCLFKYCGENMMGTMAFGLDWHDWVVY